MNTVSVNEKDIKTVRLGWSEVEGHDCLKRAIEVALVDSHPIAIFANQHSCAGELVRRAADAAKARGVPFQAVVYPVCPCGNYGSFYDECNCSVKTIERHLGKMASRRGEFHIWIESIERPPTGRPEPPENLDAVMERVEKARGMEPPSSAGIEKSELFIVYRREFRPTLVDVMIAKRVAESVARLDGRAEVEDAHIAEALQYGFLTCPLVKDLASVETVEVKA